MKKFTYLCILLIAGCVQPHINPPNPPNPPAPPTPVVDVIPAPGDVAVLIVTPADKSAEKPYSNALTSTAMITYLNAHCRKTNNVPQWKILASDVDLTYASDFWKGAMEKSKGKKLPWMGITNLKTSKGVDADFSADENDNLELLKKWGGE